MASRADSRGRSASAMMPSGRPARATSTAVRPEAASASSLRMNRGIAQAALFDQAMVADERVMPARPSLRRRGPVSTGNRPIRAARCPTQRLGRGWRGRPGARIAPRGPRRFRESRRLPCRSAESRRRRAATPFVSVPVLSNATHRTVPTRSRCTPPLINTPLRAAVAMADTTETGVEMTSAQGHEITSRTSAR